MTIKELLKGIGIKIFIKYFEDFSNKSLKINDLIEILPNKYTENSKKTRTSKARTIIKNDELLEETLKYIINFSKTDSDTKTKAKKILNYKNTEIINHDDMEDKNLYEGTKKQIIVNAYERNIQAKRECLKHYGYQCSICDLNFEKIYGKIGKNFIHVHNIVDISIIGDTYKINPITDLIPVCPNCHAMLHKKKPAYTPNEIKQFINND